MLLRFILLLLCFMTGLRKLVRCICVLSGEQNIQYSKLQKHDIASYIYHRFRDCKSQGDSQMTWSATAKPSMISRGENTRAFDPHVEVQSCSIPYSTVLLFDQLCSCDRYGAKHRPDTRPLPFWAHFLKHLLFRILHVMFSRLVGGHSQVAFLELFISSFYFSPSSTRRHRTTPGLKHSSCCRSRGPGAPLFEDLWARGKQCFWQRRNVAPRPKD